MPPYIVQPTLSQGPVAGQANQSQVTIPGIVPGAQCYSFGRVAGYNDAPTQNTEFGETLTVATIGRQFSIRSFAGMNQNSPAIGFEVLTPTVPTTMSIQVEAAFIDISADYRLVGAALTAAGSGTINLGTERWNFIRFNLTAITGTGVIIARFVF